jgi:mannose-6-phosphate isomerase-like protein (cupin superfamily)
MKLEGIPFQVVDWSQVPPTAHPGDPGTALWRTVEAGNVRARIVEYSPGYVADHWCERGHVLLVLEGQLVTELRDGRTFVMGPGQSYVVADGDGAHRSRSPRGVRLFIVD